MLLSMLLLRRSEIQTGSWSCTVFAFARVVRHFPSLKACVRILSRLHGYR